VASYKVAIKASAAKELEALPKKDCARVAARIRGLANEPRPPGAEKLSGDEKYRIRQGDYRIIYAVDDGEHTVTIVKIGHRRDVYRS
jgi:mRNA interferase RelE/StbE